MKKIELSKHRACKNAKLNLVALIDDEDFNRVSKNKWNVEVGVNTYYARRTDRSTGKDVSTPMHRFIMGAKRGQMIDHKDGNGLNNQKSNLRLCTYSQNRANAISTSKSKYLGVSIAKGKWQASIKKNGKTIYIGRFNTAENAATAYNIYAEKHHGEFARLNS